MGLAVDKWLYPESTFLWPISDTDAMLYFVFVQKIAHGFSNGDALLWEHRSDPSAILANFHFWPLILGTIYKYGGDFAYLATWFIVIALWLYALFRLCVHLGQPRPYAFFTAGMQVFFIVNLAYQVNGLRGRWESYNFWCTELVRLYPSVISMCVYSSAVLLVALAIKTRRWLTIAPASILVALTSYGRPFDWLVLLGALGILCTIQFVQGSRKQAGVGTRILILSVIFSIPFVLSQLHYHNNYKNSFLEQMGRGGLQVKLLPHYLKYAIVCVVTIGAIGIAFRKILFRKQVSNAETGDEAERFTICWICAIVVSGLLAHFTSAFQGGVTIVGFSYFFVFSVAPWSYFLAMHFFWTRGASSRWRDLFQSKVWVLAFFMPAAFQQLTLAAGLRTTMPHLVVETERRRVYDRIKMEPPTHRVVLTLGRGIEASVFADAWLFFPHPVVATSSCSASNAELLERYLFTKLLLTGTLDDVAGLFSDKGVPDLDQWLSRQDSKTQFWHSLLRETIGFNTYVFHPQKNRGELRFRKIVLPRPVAGRDTFVVYFTPDLRRIFEKYHREATKDPFQLLSQPLRLDYVYVPAQNLPFIDSVRLKLDPVFREMIFEQPVDGKLWKVQRGL